ncbi:ABC transporter permease subunit [Rhodobacter sp. SGA-6-6]|uniref:ABC transporter permease n=1 Tax=Rhodobacter sp. SGA-6-6 TaxID=2710882 RepID=UPI0013EDA438|nr:ABC transporter permease subunit [Rhodobacter sp. SGA-6-6]NGM44253.1 ABC transporter permease subunit [Rhodobacter sp. SGA-6-6]
MAIERAWWRSGSLRNLLILLILWEVVGHLKLVAGGALPPLSAILIRFWIDRADYPGHVAATVWASVLGFVIGNVAAIGAGVLFVLFPRLQRLARGVNIAVFALPPIAIAPILVLTLQGMAPRVVLAALGVYFVTMTATVVGLSQYDTRSADVVRAYGGGNWRVMKLVRLRGAIPDILGGLRIAAPNAVLGAILAEFGGGGRWGLGTYLLGSLGRGEPARLWGIGLVATLIAGASYAVFALVSARILGSTRSVTLNTALPPSDADADAPLALRIALMAGAAALPFVLWWAFIRLTGVPEMIAKTPWGVVDYLFLADASATARAKLLAALAQTLPITALGMVAGLGFAFLLAISSRMIPGFIRAFMPVALVTQTMPLVALTPLLVLMLGRGLSVTLWITISVTFFPAFVLLVQGLQRVPQSVLDLPRAYGAPAWKELRMVSIPAALPYLFAATRLTVPRALLGVMIAEWLATGTGLGNLLNQSRGYLDYGMIWTVAAVSVCLSVAFYYAVLAVERRVLTRLGMQVVE